MKFDKLKVYTLSFALAIILLISLIFRSNINRKILCVILFVFMLLTVKLIGKRRIKSIYIKQITIILTLFAIMYVAILYIMGIYFGFYPSSVLFSPWAIGNYILPITITIVSSEIIRYVFLSREEKGLKLLILISMVLIETILYLNTYEITSATTLLTLIGFIMFAAIANNLLFNYIVVNFGGFLETTIYRLITTLYIYIFPLTPNIYVFLESIIRMVYPYIIYLVLEMTYTKKTFVVARMDRKKNIIVNTIIIIISILIVLMVSGNFKYGVLVVGSGSMTGTINKGDIIIYENYDDSQKISDGDIMVFSKESIKIVHRVTEVKVVNGERRYFTKGDANSNSDDGYRLQGDMIGKVKVKIPYIGWLTLWINDLFN